MSEIEAGDYVLDKEVAEKIEKLCKELNLTTVECLCTTAFLQFFADPAGTIHILEDLIERFEIWQAITPDPSKAN